MVHFNVHHRQLCCAKSEVVQIGNGPATAWQPLSAVEIRSTT